MTTTAPPVTVRIHAVWPWLFRIAGPVLGFGLGFVVAPLGRWLAERFDIAPSPLKFLAALPVGWAVVVTTVVGLVGGIWLASVALRESLAVTVDGSQVRLAQDGKDVRLSRDVVGAARRDGSDLVVLDRRGAELARRKGSDLSWTAVRDAFERHGYGWEAAEHDDRFRSWVDGADELGSDEHHLLRARSRALADGRAGTADDLREQLQARGVVIRDRDGAQQIRTIAST